jgi:hypothetical protein
MRYRSTYPLIIAALMSACGGTASTDPSIAGEPDPNGVTNTESALLAKTDVGYGTIEFSTTTLADGRVAIVVTEMRSAYLKSTPMDTMLNGERPLTTLEMFKAINPDLAVPAQILAAHEIESAALGRQTNEVLHATFDRNAPIEKGSAACDGFVFATRTSCHFWGNKQRMDFIGGFPTVVLPLGRSNTDFSYQTMNFAALGACNESSSNISERFMTQTDATGPWIFNPFFTVPPGTAARHWVNVSRVGPDHCGIAFCQHPGAYREQGNGSLLDLRAAEEFFDNSCVH